MQKRALRLRRAWHPRVTGASFQQNNKDQVLPLLRMCGARSGLGPGPFRPHSASI